MKQVFNESLSTTTSTTSGRIAWDATNDKILIGDGTATLAEFASSTLIQVAKTANYTPAVSDLSDKDKLIEFSSATGVTFTVPTNANNPYPIGTQINILQTNTGQVTVAGAAGVTVNGTPGLKLRAQWSPELAQDVSAFHNIDAEAELTALLSEQVAAEIDREILRDLRKGAAWNLRWDYNGWRRVQGLTTSYTQKDWNQTLITAINQLSAQIHKSTLRGGANWIVVSSEVSAIFDDLEYFHVSNASPEQDQYNMGIERVGTLAGRYPILS